MDDIAHILTYWARRQYEAFALATVVRTTGSTYRKAGARMLISQEGETLGLVSGGCLEQEIAGHGRRVLRDLKPVLLTFDTRRLLGCNGALDLLVEPVLPGNESGIFVTAQNCLARRRSLVASTLFQAESPLDQLIGTHPLIADDGTAFSLRGLPNEVHADGGRLLHNDHPVVRHYPVGTGSAAVLLHNVRPPVRLYVCGGGPDVLPLIAMATQLGWEVVAVVHPSQEPPSLPAGCRLLEADGATLAKQVTPDARTACVIMTHHYGRDLALLGALLPLRLPYMGLLGPGGRCQGILNSLLGDDLLPDLSVLNSLHSPVGLDIGADGPGEIALAVIAEIKAVLSGRKGGFLRDRKTAIHAAPELVGAR